MTIHNTITQEGGGNIAAISESDINITTTKITNPAALNTNQLLLERLQQLAQAIDKAQAQRAITTGNANIAKTQVIAAQQEGAKAAPDPGVLRTYLEFIASTVSGIAQVTNIVTSIKAMLDALGQA